MISPGEVKFEFVGKVFDEMSKRTHQVVGGIRKVALLVCSVAELER